jgi:peptide deformylase
MIQPLKYYPDTSININAGPIRSFGKSYKQMVEDIIDTMKKHNLHGLSAIQIGYPYQLMVIKEEAEYIPYANARIITQAEPFDSKEKSIYFKNHPITVMRYEKLSIVYEDETGNMKTKKIDNKEEAALFQRKLDYLFNGTLIDRLKPQQREQAIKALAGKGIMPETTDIFCPPFSKKEYFVSVADKILFFMFISLLLPLFNISKDTLSSWYTYDKFAFPIVIIIMIGYFFYAQYEAKQFKQCTSCQVGNNIGVIVKRIGLGFVFFVASYFVIG